MRWPRPLQGTGLIRNATRSATDLDVNAGPTLLLDLDLGLPMPPPFLADHFTTITVTTADGRTGLTNAVFDASRPDAGFVADFHRARRDGRQQGRACKGNCQGQRLSSSHGRS